MFWLHSDRISPGSEGKTLGHPGVEIENLRNVKPGVEVEHEPHAASAVSRPSQRGVAWSVSWSAWFPGR